MQKCAGAIITWLIHQQAIQERDRELYTYALYNMVLLLSLIHISSFPVGKVDFMDLYAFKIYMLDVGLLLAMADLDASVIIDGNRIFTEFKGALTEQYVLQQMIAELGVEPYYYTTANSTGEIDFMLQAPGSVILVEVKAEENLRAKSLRAFCEKYHPKHAVRTSMSDFREQDWMTNTPLYNIDRIGEYLK